MTFQYLLYYSVVLCWGLNVFFLARFALEWHKNEPCRVRAWAAIAVISGLAVALTVFLPVRGGYDNNHDFMCLGERFFTYSPGRMLMFKEVSPLFTDGISDFLTGNSLSAVLWKNRLLQVFSIFVFFSGLRRLGASMPVAAASTVFLFLNFLSPLNASSFSTTSSNMLIWMISLLAIFDAFAAPGPGAAGAAWIMSSLVLVISARIEFLPVNLLLLAGLAAGKILGGNRFFLRPGNIAVIATGAFPAAAWAFHSLAQNPANQVAGNIHPLINFFYQLGSRNLEVIAGFGLKLQGPGKVVNNAFSAASTALCIAFILLALSGIAAGCLAERKGAKARLAALALLALWAAYFSTIFQPMDFYPLHFMRHQLYFFVPFAYLFALGLDGFERAAVAGGKSVFAAFCLVALTSYAALNAKAALGFNRELRTNDRELDFLMKAQREWPAQAFAVHPVRNRSNSRAEMIKKYFPAMPDCRSAAEGALLKYASPEPEIFTDSEPGLLDQAPLPAGPPEAAWKAISFKHSFYTAFFGRVEETVEPIPLTIGFFRFGKTGRDRAFLETANGVCDLALGNSRKAAVKFGRAVAADPACLNCRYFLSLSYAAQGKEGAARAELAKTEKLSRAKVPAPHRALVEDLARGETDKAAESAREISHKNPDFFFRRNFSQAIQDLGRKRRPEFATPPAAAGS